MYSDAYLSPQSYLSSDSSISRFQSFDIRFDIGLRRSLQQAQMQVIFIEIHLILHKGFAVLFEWLKLFEK
jgi:hypothetical protein